MISFIIPTLNEETVLEKLLQCLSRYSGEKEIIISDGKSTDKTLEIARKYTQNIVIYSGVTRQTISMARNAGAALAHGEYLVFLDADVYIENPDVFFTQALSYFDQNKNLVGLSGYIKVLPAMETVMDALVFGFNYYSQYVYNNILHIGAASGEFQMIRSDAFKRINGYNEHLVAVEDYDMFIRLNKIGRTKIYKDLKVFHTGRRAHKIGWPKLLYTWFSNSLSYVFFNKAITKVWEEVR